MQIETKNLGKKFFFNLLCICLFAYLFICLFVYFAYADTMTNGSYNLQMGNLNPFSGKASGSSFNLNDTGGQTGAGLYSSASGQNYKIRSGFQYIKSIIPFAFSISQTTIDFGTVTAANPVTRTNTLTVSNNSAYGYDIFAFENHQLMNPGNGTQIPDTTCDNGLCTQTTSADWVSNLTYGFGYRCDNSSGSDCATGFTSGNAYKQFANTSNNESAVAVMSGTIDKANQSQVTYKLNISGSQPAGLYSNVIFFIATPKY